MNNILFISKYCSGAKENIQLNELFIEKYVYERQKFSAFAYRLSNKSIGTLFSDKTQIIETNWYVKIEFSIELHSKFRFISFSVKQYFNKSGKKIDLSTLKNDIYIEKKLRLFNYFKKFLTEKRQSANEYRFDQVIVHSWIKTTNAFIVYLSNGILQICFVDRLKVIIDCVNLTLSISCANEKTKLFSIEKLIYSGISEDMQMHLNNAIESVTFLIKNM